MISRRLTRLNKTNNHVILMGDINVELVKDTQSQDLIDTLENFNLHLSSPLAVKREE